MTAPARLRSDRNLSEERWSNPIGHQIRKQFLGATKHWKAVSTRSSKRSWFGVAPPLTPTDGLTRSGDWVTHHRSGQAAIDFVGRCADNGERATPLDGKYISGSWKRDALSIRNSAFGSGILATRDVLSADPADPVWAVPASFIAYALANPV